MSPARGFEAGGEDRREGGALGEADYAVEGAVGGEERVEVREAGRGEPGVCREGVVAAPPGVVGGVVRGVVRGGGGDGAAEGRGGAEPAAVGGLVGGVGGSRGGGGCGGGFPVGQVLEPELEGAGGVDELDTPEGGEEFL